MIEIDFDSYTGFAAQMAVDLVNTVDLVAKTDGLTTVDELASFLSAYAPLWNSEVGQPSDSDLRQIRRLRNRLRSVFEAGDAAAAARQINDILEGAGARPRITLYSSSPHIGFEPKSASLPHQVATAAALGLSELLVEGGIERFGTCCSDVCVDVFVDTSKNRSRRHCSNTCSNRQNVAAHRRRAKEGHAT